MQMASLNLFDKMHKARTEEQQTPPPGNAGETPPDGQQGSDSQGEKKP